MSFTLKIQLGNAAMLNGLHVAEALRRVAATLERTGGLDDSGRIRDFNGNTVGEWDLEGAEPDEEGS